MRRENHETDIGVLRQVIEKESRIRRSERYFGGRVIDGNRVFHPLRHHSAEIERRVRGITKHIQRIDDVLRCEGRAVAPETIRAYRYGELGEIGVVFVALRQPWSFDA